MFDVFRFAWFAVRTFLGVIALVLTLYAALWLFVKILSAAPGNNDPGAALRRVESYNARDAARERMAPLGPKGDAGACAETRGAGCDRR